MPAPALNAESERLARSWMRHDATWLRDYLVSGVEDPRINIQSILSRHFTLRALFESRFEDLMQQEIRFGAVMNWLIAVAGQEADSEVFRAILYALQCRASNAEGLLIPPFVVHTFASLPRLCGGMRIENYIEKFLTGTRFAHERALLDQASIDTFLILWRTSLASTCSPDSGIGANLGPQPVTILEPACGSANDYRFFDTYGLAQFTNYTGFDLCAKNIENALALFPNIRFTVGNVFEIQATDQSYDLCMVHDLFEHLSLHALDAAVYEICRVTRCAICVGFFQMDETDDHLVRPVHDYYWNLLSRSRMQQLFASRHFAAQIIHIGTFLRETVGCEQTYNPNAYTFVLRRLNQK